MRNQRIKIGLVQMKCTENRETNLKKAIAGIEHAAGKGARVVCLPELFLSPYFCQGPKDERHFNLAESIPGPTTNALGDIAKKRRLVIVCSLFEKNPVGKFFEKRTHNNQPAFLCNI